MIAYDWPGNVREMINVLQKAIISDPENPTLYPMHLPTEIRIKHTQSGLSGRYQQINVEEMKAEDNSKLLNLSRLINDSPLSMKALREKITDECETQYLEHLMALTNNNLKKTSEISGLSLSRLYALLRKHNIAVK